MQIWLYEQADLRIEGLIIVSVFLFCSLDSQSKTAAAATFLSTSSLSLPLSLDLLALSPRFNLRSFPRLYRAPISLTIDDEKTPLKRTQKTSLQGFDEYMNMVVDEAEEVSAKRRTRRHLGRILLKGDAISLMRPVTSTAA